MNINNGFNILPWHNSLEKQNCKKWYAYGQAWPLLCPQGFILPFQFISDTAITISSNICAISVETGQTIDLGVKPTVTEISRADITYYIVKLVSTSIVNLPIGRYNLRMNTSEGFLYSEELVVINNANECIKVEYWNEDTLKFTSGEINFTDDFHFIFYINSTIGKPEYEFEEELTKRLGYKFIESQTSNKVYKFSFVAPEYICDAMRLIRMCDYIKLTTKFDSYNALSFAYEPKWQEQGDLAAVDVEFDTDCIIQKLESFNRRAKESFYNALLADIDEPVLFSTDTVAQYYTEYTTSGTISGKLIRQLTAISEDELVSSLSSIVLPVDNQSDNSQVAKKAFLSDIVNKLIPKVNLSEYLLKSVWDKVFEIRTDKQGKEYIFGKLPVVTQYGITMYADGGDIDLPSLYTGLPIDGKTLIRDKKGVLMVNPDIELGGGVSNFWDLSGIPSWITNSKPKYTYSEIEGTPDLSGYATESWVLGKSYITSATLGTELGRYVTLDTDQSLKGKKDFKNGLSIDGLELRKSQDDVIYIDANLVVRGGVTMYAQNDVDIPSIIDAIPTASTTVKGIASFDGNYFSVDANGKVSLIASNVGLNEEELYNYLTSNNYAKKTDIPSLVGYATQSWVNTRIDSLINGAPAAYDTLKEIADVLQGNVNSIGDIITALGTKWTQDNTKIANWDTAYSWGNHANVGYALKSYVDSTFVTLGSTQTITGEKNFTGGLKVNGSHIYYDTEKKYWKLEGDLLVTGGVTMYGSDSSFTPSTIMDAIAVDGITISKSGGVLKVIGGTGGGVADSVAWGNITGKPTWIGSSKPTYSYSEITGAISTTELQNYLTQNSYMNVTSGDNRYLQLSGGTLDGVLTLRASNSSSDSWIEFSNKSNSVVHKLGVRRPESSYGLHYYNGSEYYKIWHEGNFTPSNYLPLSGGTITSASPVSVTLNANNDGQTALFLQSKGTNKTYVGWDINRGTCLYDFSSDSHFGILNGIPRFNSNTIWHSGNDGDGSGLEADTIGTYKKDSGEKTIIYGTRSDNSNIRRIYDNGWNLMCQNGSDNGVIATLNSNVASATKLQTARTIWGQSFDGTKDIDGDITIKGALIGKTSTTGNLESYVGNASGGVGGDGALMYAYGSRNLYFYTKSALRMIIESSGNVGIGTTSPTKKLHIYDSNISNDSILLLEKGNAYDSRLELINSVDSLSIIQQSTGNAFISLKGNHSLIFETSNSARFTIDSLGNVGIGTASPSYKLDVSGEIRMSGAGIIGGGLYFTGIGSGTYNKGSIMCNNTYGYEIEAPRATDSATGTALPIFIGWRGGALGIKITSGGNLLANGGITMYSDQRKKTILNHVELSLKDIANAPLIEHYYNSDDAKTTHVGSIAQYWASMNDWFCKLDSEGYYTMEIQNAALASAISIARELDRYETKTDKAIKKLKKRICELEEEVKLLKAS